MSKKRSKAGKGPATKARKKEKPRTRSARSQTLPGMETVRSRKLDNICEAIGDERDLKNKAIQEERKLLPAALHAMQELRLGAYRHAGVELTRVPGAEKIRVRVTSEEGDAGQHTDEQATTERVPLSDDTADAIDTAEKAFG